MSSASTGLRALHPTLQVRMALFFVERFLDTMIAPLVTLYLVQRLGPGLTGLLMLIAVGVAFASGVVTGHLSDRHGRRAALLVSSALTAVALLGMAAAAAPWWRSVTVVYLCYVVFVAMAGSIRPVHDAIVIDLAPPESRRAVFALNYWSTNAALGVGVLLGGFLYTRHFDALLTGSAVLAALAAVATLILVRESAPERTRETPGGYRELLRGYRRPLRDPAFLRLLIAFTLVLGVELQLWSGFAAVHIADTLPRQALLPFSQVHFEVNGVELLGILRAENTALVIVLAIVVERLARHASATRRILLGLALFGAGYAALVLTGRPYLLLVAIAAATVGELLHVPMMQALLAQLVPEQFRTRYMALFHLNLRGAMAIAALSLTVGGVLPAPAFALVYLGLVGGAVLLYRSVLRSPHAAAEQPDNDNEAATAERAVPAE
jgi:MFS transporter, DHA1 family, multidrug resistance protein B